tara:strand:+ start:3563 stop:4075 length:513 start_codon:yes stop_codon:yes gene_type:complete
MTDIDQLFIQCVSELTTKKTKQWMQAIEISTKIIESTDLQNLCRASSIDDIINAYNIVSNQPCKIDASSLYKNKQFCKKWLKFHDKKIDDAYIEYGSRPIIEAHETKQSTPQSDIFSCYEQSCTIKLQIDPKLQEWYVKNPRIKRKEGISIESIREFQRENLFNEKVDEK